MQRLAASMEIASDYRYAYLNAAWLNARVAAALCDE